MLFPIIHSAHVQNIQYKYLSDSPRCFFGLGDMLPKVFAPIRKRSNYVPKKRINISHTKGSVIGSRGAEGEGGGEPDKE
jgi:hypothetical protein